MDNGEIIYLKPGTRVRPLDPKKGPRKQDLLLRNESGLAQWNALNATVSPSSTKRIVIQSRIKQTRGVRGCRAKMQMRIATSALSSLQKALNSRWLPENVQADWLYHSAWRSSGKTDLRGRWCKLYGTIYLFAVVDIGDKGLNEHEQRSSIDFKQIAKAREKEHLICLRDEIAELENEIAEFQLQV